MTTIFLLFIIALICSLVGTRLSIPLATKIGMLDQPDGYRKIHPHPIPRFGGPAIFIAFFVPIILLLYHARFSLVSEVLVRRPRELTGLFVGASMALVLGVIDDRFELRARWKLAWQILIGVVVCWYGYGITVVSNPFGHPFVLGIFSWPVTIFWFVACMNAVNLADGMDGLAAGICLFVSLTLFVLSLEFTNLLGLLLMACLAGAILGFLTFNFPPARIFLGDSGSLLLGFLVAALSLIASKKAEAALALFIPVVALGLPIIDTLLAIVRRWYHRLPLSSPDREHIHHALVTMGFSRRRAVLILYGVCLLLGAAALVMTLGHGELAFLVIVFLLLVVYASLRIFGQVTVLDLYNKLTRDDAERRRSMAALTATNRALSRLSLAASLDELWTACVPVFESLDLTSARMRLFSSPGEPAAGAGGGGESQTGRVWTWTAAAGKGAARARPENGLEVEGAGNRFEDHWVGRLVLMEGRRCLGEFSIDCRSQVHPMLPETSELLVRLRQKLVTEIARVVSRSPLRVEPETPGAGGGRGKA